MNSTDLSPNHAGRHALALAGWLALSFSAACTAIFISPGSWYADLAKPSWGPPNWIFGPVWTLLYVMMAVAAWLVAGEGGWKFHRKALGLFLLQLLLNALWTPLFFGIQQPALAFAEIVVFWLVLTATVRSFWRVKKAAGLLLAPYLAWVTFAAVLNFAIWQLNA